MDDTTKDKVTEICNKLSMLLDELYTLISTEKDTEKQKQLIILAQKLIRVPLCQTVSVVVPDHRQKLDEYIFASKNPEFKVRQEQNGADLIDVKTQKKIELKTSHTEAKKKYKSNIMFDLSKIKSKPKKRDELIKKIKEKTENGGFVIFPDDNSFYSKYEFDSDFFIEILKHKEIATTSSTKLNFGSTRCSKCKTYHRLEKMKELQDKYKNDPKGILDAEWNTILNVNIKAQCKK